MSCKKNVPEKCHAKMSCKKNVMQNVMQKCHAKMSCKMSCKKKCHAKCHARFSKMSCKIPVLPISFVVFMLYSCDRSHSH